MRKALSQLVATCSLTGCVVCHVWALIVVIREFAQGGISEVGKGVSTPLVLLYMAAVCLFNWHAVTSGSGSYRKAALVLTAVQLAGALVQGAAAEAIVTAETLGGSSLAEYGIALPAILNLPMNSTAVIRQPASLLPWLTAGFFAANLAVISFRIRRTAEQG